MRKLDLAGKRCGKITITEFLGSHKGRRIWAYKCDCGKTGKGSASNLSYGKTNTCGCSRKTFPARHVAILNLECDICKKHYKYHHRWFRNGTSGHKGAAKLCSGCEGTRKKRANKLRCIEYKGGKCERCGYSKCARALSFHHKDPAEKRFNISRPSNYSWMETKKELDRCTLLCENCHREVEAELDKIPHGH